MGKMRTGDLRNIQWVSRPYVDTDRTVTRTTTGNPNGDPNLNHNPNSNPIYPFCDPQTAFYRRP